MKKEMISKQDLHPDLVAELEHLKKLHDHDYACKCILDDLEKEYNSIICTDIWYEASKEYLNKKINTNKLDSLISSFRYKQNVWYDTWQGFSNITYCGLAGSSYLTASDIEFSINDGINSNNKIIIKDLHNAYPDVVLEDKFKQFCIEYKRNNEK